MYFNIDFKSKYIFSVLKNGIELEAEVDKLWNNKHIGVAVQEYSIIIKKLRETGKTPIFVTNHGGGNIQRFSYCTYNYFIKNHSLREFKGSKSYERLLLNFKLQKIRKL